MKTKNVPFKKTFKIFLLKNGHNRHETMAEPNLGGLLLKNEETVLKVWNVSNMLC